MRYDYVVSLGGNCEVAEHVRRYFGIKVTFPFDWWVTPFESCCHLIEQDFSDLFDNISLDRRHQAVISNTYGMYHHHDFVRDEKSHVIEDQIASQIPDLKIKFMALTNRMRQNLSFGRKILFIRSWREILHEGKHYPRHLIRGVPQYDFDRLIAALAHRFPDIEFQCLFVNYGHQRTADKRALFHNIQDKGDIRDWRGSALGWDEMFRSLGIVWDQPN